MYHLRLSPVASKLLRIFEGSHSTSYYKNVLMVIVMMLNPSSVFYLEAPNNSSNNNNQQQAATARSQLFTLHGEKKTFRSILHRTSPGVHVFQLQERVASETCDKTLEIGRGGTRQQAVSWQPMGRNSREKHPGLPSSNNPRCFFFKGLLVLLVWLDWFL